MKKILVVLLLVTISLTGCSRNREIENQLTEYEVKIADLEAQLTASRDEVSDYEMQVETLTQQKKVLDKNLSNALELNGSLREYIARLEEENEGSQGGAEPNEEPRFGLYYFHSSEGFLSSYVAPKSYDTYISIDIIGYPESEELERSILDVSGEEKPTIAFEITGILYNLKIERITWNEDLKGYTIDEEVCHYEKVTNSTLLFDSILAEGLPGELLTWEDEEGEKFYYLIHDTTMRGDVTLSMIISGKAKLNPWWEESE